ncbi:DUF2515 family protein [Litchfieldia salsa]|uniref:DUF2515 domain-containing protein n=1 Tax=Litchfieldia salsa TaxID=930152 RepID=A0A1H0TEN1_9BACI|nr:DUF2515 family protein [Litchfieldia salsa]SDP52281.1 Protein of unknown function [Litchfieldia salsa]
MCCLFFKKKKLRKIINSDELLKLKQQLNEQIDQDVGPSLLVGEEKEIVHSIRDKTANLNINNLTRTEAYLKYYQRNPEVHWSFLAHMVSRNAGYNMTDIKGEIIGELIPEKEKINFFNFLERSNALIFNDAFPQLLLYEYSKNKKKSYFHLLNALHVSSFMLPVWNHFYSTNNSNLLTVALIINEQNYIEQRVMTNPLFKGVIDSIQFKLQELFGFTMVLFPFVLKKDKYLKLAGSTVKDFTSLNERINMGKCLYSILFYIKKVREGAYTFATNTPHTGSRADYYSSIFSKQSNSSSKKIHSPILSHAWSNFNHKYNDHSDWFHNDSIYQALESLPTLNKYDITDDYMSKLITLYSIESLVDFLN